jgi:DNA adenine methylase
MDKEIDIRAKSPLRYPGGKSRALKQILPIIPNFREYREPMVGGGSVFFALKHKFPNKKFWINDINRELYLFWKACKLNNQKLLDGVIKLKKNYEDGKKLYLRFNGKVKNLTDIQRAIRFFLLNRITFSGLAESGGYSDESFNKRFTFSSFDRLEKSEMVLKKVKISNIDYNKVITKDGEEVFIFLDPPYFRNGKSKLYGKEGKIHSDFNHELFAKNTKRCKHKWLITYDNSPKIIEMFSYANIYTWELQYGMNNYKQKSAKIGQELFISNYEIPSLKDKKIN